MLKKIPYLLLSILFFSVVWIIGCFDVAKAQVMEEDSSMNVTAEIIAGMTFIVQGVDSGEIINGEVTNIDTTATDVNFGVFQNNRSAIGAQDLLVSTNSMNGFTVTIQTDDNLRTAGGVNYIDSFSGTNDLPVVWVDPPGSGIEGYFGYTTNDSILETAVTSRFIVNKWAGLSTLPYEVFYNNVATQNNVIGEGITRVGYRLSVTMDQAPGSYSAMVTYICVPHF